MLLGKNGKWQWITSKAACLSDVVELCPQLFIDRFVLITSFDSGLVTLDEEKLKAGWKPTCKRRRNFDWSGEVWEEPLALSPRVSDPKILPTDMYDEWYVFCTEPQIDTIEVFVNWEFSPTFGHIGMQELGMHVELEAHFWNQLAVINPRAYIADNQTLSFATADDALFEQVMIAVQDVELEVGTACDAKSANGPG
jgi:hypothetical protein